MSSVVCVFVWRLREPWIGKSLQSKTLENQKIF